MPTLYHHWCCGFDYRSGRGVLNTTLCDKVCQWLVAGWWFFPGNPVSATNKTDSHDITEILLKVALNTIKPTIFLDSLKYLTKITFYLFCELDFSEQSRNEGEASDIRCNKKSISSKICKQ